MIAGTDVLRKLRICLEIFQKPLLTLVWTACAEIQFALSRTILMMAGSFGCSKCLTTLFHVIRYFMSGCLSTFWHKIGLTSGYFGGSIS